MKQKTHAIHNLVLLYIILISIIGFRYFQYQPFPQLMVVGLAVLSYILWGTLHHYFEDRLKSSIIVEYVLIGALVFVLFALSLLR